MASFSSGVMISKSEAERRRGDEMRMRKAGIDPTKTEDQWSGVVTSRRQHRAARTDVEADKERAEAEALPIDLSTVLAKKPDSRLKWLQKGLVLAAKSRVSFKAIYDIVMSSKFGVGISANVGKEMKAMLIANLHLFNVRQQKALQPRLDSFIGGSKRDEAEEPRNSKMEKKHRSRSRSGLRTKTRRRKEDSGTRDSDSAERQADESSSSGSRHRRHRSEKRPNKNKKHKGGTEAKAKNSNKDAEDEDGEEDADSAASDTPERKS